MRNVWVVAGLLPLCLLGCAGVDVGKAAEGFGTEGEDAETDTDTDGEAGAEEGGQEEEF